MRVNKKATILHIAAQEYNETYIRFLNELLNCSKDGIIYNFIINNQDEIINKVFEGNRNSYYECYVTLVKDKYITLKGLELHILPWNDTTLFSMKYNLQQKNKRAYRKDAVQDQITFSKYASETLGSSSEVKEELLPISDKWENLKGIKIPRNFKDLLSGQVDSFNYTKEKIRYLLGLIAIANSNEEIKAFNVQYTHSKLSEVFEENTIALSTCYYVHNQLIKDEIITVYKDPAGYNNLRINGCKEGFRKGYIAVPYLIFQKVFKAMETAAIKIFFDVAFKLNNGENGKGKADNNKPVIFKADINATNNKESIIRHTKTLERLKKRSRSEMLKLFSGTEGRPGLNSIFNIDLHAIKKGLIYIRMKTQYIIQKSEAAKASFFSAADRFKKKAAIVKDTLIDTAISLNDKEFDSVVEKLRKANTRAIKAVIKVVNNEIIIGNKINDIVSYIKAVYDRYMSGERIQLSLDDITADNVEKLSDPYEAIWMSME